NDDRQTRLSSDDPHAPGLSASWRAIQQHTAGEHIYRMRNDASRDLLIHLFPRKRLEYGTLQAFAQVSEPGQILPAQRRFAQDPATQLFKTAAKFFVPGLQVAYFPFRSFLG